MKTIGMFFTNIAKLIDVKTILTLSLTGCLIYMVLSEMISAEAFMGIYATVITFYFNKPKKIDEESKI